VTGSLRSLFLAKGEEDRARDLGSLVVPAAGALVKTLDPWEPYCLNDPGGRAPPGGKIWSWPTT
jgi:hypothetical protein